LSNRLSLARLAKTLGHTRRGFVGVIDVVRVEATTHGVHAEEIEKRLLELGFVEGARVEVLHEGAIGRDPIAVRVHSATVALRRSEAMAIRVRRVAKL
jgi:ferrous iron transport protein A